MMEDLVNETLKTLKDAKEKYNNAIISLQKSTSQLVTLEKGFNVMLTEESAEHEKFVEKIRASTNGHCNALTIGMIIADSLGCLGICSAIVTPTCWRVGIITTEAAIKEYTEQLEELEMIAESVIDQANQASEKFSEAVSFLVKELDIILNWKVSAENVKETIETYSIVRMKQFKVYQEVFKASILDLENAAKDFLAQPEKIFADNKQP